MSKNRKKYLKLQYLRKKYGLTQEKMATLLGVCTSSYSHKEIGLSGFSFDEVMIIHSELNKIAAKHGDTKLTLEDIFLD